MPDHPTQVSDYKEDPPSVQGETAAPLRKMSAIISFFFAFALAGGALFSIHNGGIGWGTFWPWAAALGLFPLSLYLFEGHRPFSDAGMNKGHKLALLAVIVLGVGLRLYRWQEIPAGIWSDELLATLNGIRVLESASTPPFGTLPLVAEWPDWVHTFNLYSYFVAGCLKVFGIGHFGVKSLSILPGILLLPGVFWLTKEIAGTRPALFATLMLALSRWGLTQSRFEWDGTLHLALVTFALAFTARGLNQKRWAFMAVGGTLVGLAQFSYLASRLSAAGMALGLIALFLVGQKMHLKRSQIFKGALVFAFASFLAAAPVLHFTFNDEAVAKSRIEQLQLDDGGIFSDTETIKKNSLAYLNAFVGEGPKNARQNIPLAPLLPSAVAFLALFGALWSLNLRHRPMGWLLWGVAMGALAAGALSNSKDGANAHRMGMVLPIVYVWAGLGLNWGLNHLEIFGKRHFPEKKQTLLMGLALALAMGPGVWDSHRYFTVFGQSKVHWTAVTTSRQLHLARDLKQYMDSHHIVIDASLKDRTFEVLLYSPKEGDKGGLENPIYTFALLTPRGHLPREMPGPLKPTVLAVHARQSEHLKKRLKGVESRLVKDPFDRPIYRLFFLEPGQLETIRKATRKTARALSKNVFMQVGDLQKPGMFRLEKMSKKGPWGGGTLDRKQRFVKLPDGPQTFYSHPGAWFAHLYIKEAGIYLFFKGERSKRFQLVIDGKTVLLNNVRGIKLSAGPHNFTVRGQIGRFNRISVDWQPPSAKEPVPLPMGVLRPRLPPNFKLLPLKRKN